MGFSGLLVYHWAAARMSRHNPGKGPHRLSNIPERSLLSLPLLLLPNHTGGKGANGRFSGEQMIEVDYIWSGEIGSVHFFWKIFSWSSRSLQENKNNPPTPYTHKWTRHRATSILLWSQDNCWELLKPTSTPGKSPLSCHRNALG